MLAEILSYAGKGVTNDDFVTATDNLAGARWTKLSINAAFSSLSTMTGLTFGQVAKKTWHEKTCARYATRMRCRSEGKRGTTCQNTGKKRRKIVWRKHVAKAIHRVPGIAICYEKA